MSKIRVIDVNKIYSADKITEVEAISRVNINIEEGEFITLLGPSGCGKTSLLRIIAGLEIPTQGRIEINGSIVLEPREDVGFVFQSSVLLPWRNILSNVLLPIEIRGKIQSVNIDKAHELLKLTGLSDFASHFPSQLSGGMKQRAAICRALITDPAVLLMDEPFGALDAMTRDSMNEELYEIWRKSGKTIVFVTHDIYEAVRLSNRVAVMSARPGKIETIVDLNFERNTPYNERILSENYNLKYNLIRDIFYKKSVAHVFS